MSASKIVPSESLLYLILCKKNKTSYGLALISVISIFSFLFFARLFNKSAFYTVTDSFPVTEDDTLLSGKGVSELFEQIQQTSLKYYQNISDMDTIPSAGLSSFYTVAENVKGSPYPNNENVGGLQFAYDENWKAQLAFSYDLEDKLAIRHARTNGVWGTWKYFAHQQFGGFYCTKHVALDASNDLNECHDFDTMYHWSYNNYPLNMPPDCPAGTMFCVKTNWGYTQMVYHYNKPIIHIRTYYMYNSEWSEWASNGKMNTDASIIEYGTTDINLPSNGDITVEVTFSKPFSTSPVVLATLCSTTSQWGYNNLMVTQVSRYRCHIKVHNFDNNEHKEVFYISWIAIVS